VLRRGTAAAILLVCLALAALMLAPALLGYERYVITGDSMSGTYDRGSILYGREVPVEQLAVGDVITYEPPPRAGSDGLITHRIVSIRRAHGERIFRTAGDANAKPDPWRFSLDEPTQARASFAVPLAGYTFAALGIREVRMLLIGLPALGIAVFVGVRLWREAGEEVRRCAEQAAIGDGSP
jgi:signal peptidase